MAPSRRLPLSPLSAALTMATWAQTHGRPPRCTECVGQEGLHWFATYYDCFALSCWSAILDEASALTHGWLLSGEFPQTTGLKPCLNAPACSVLIPNEGAHVRLCPACRLAAQRQPFLQDVGVSRQRWQRWGVYDFEGEDWADGIDWGGHGA